MDLYGRSPLAGSICALARLPILIPGVIVGISLLILVNLAGLGPSRIAIVLGHMLVALPTTVVDHAQPLRRHPARPSAKRRWISARSEWTIFRRVMLPLAAPAIASAFMLAFLTSFDEFIVAFFLAGTEPTLPLYIWSQLRFPKSLPSVMALGTVILAVSIVIATAAELMRRRGAVDRRRPARRRSITTKRNRKRRTAMAFDLTIDARSAWRAGFAAFALLRRHRPRPRSPTDKLNYFTWSGYELPEFNKSFLAAHPDGVESSMFGDDDDAFTKVKAGFRPDIAHPCYDKIARWNKEGLLQPIDTKRIKNWDKIFPVFKNLPDIQAGDGKVWMVPWDWGNTSILYRTDLVNDPETSWNLLWDKQYAGRMATIDAVHDTPVVAALLAGVNPFDMTRGRMDKVAEKLREQRPLLTQLHDRHDLGRAVAGERRAGRGHDLERFGDGAEEAGREGRVHEAEGRHADLDLRLRHAQGRQERRPRL